MQKVIIHVHIPIDFFIGMNKYLDFLKENQLQLPPIKYKSNEISKVLFTRHLRPLQKYLSPADLKVYCKMIIEQNKDTTRIYRQVLDGRNREISTSQIAVVNNHTRKLFVEPLLLKPERQWANKLKKFCSHSHVITHELVRKHLLNLLKQYSFTKEQRGIYSKISPSLIISEKLLYYIQFLNSNGTDITIEKTF